MKLQVLKADNSILRTHCEELTRHELRLNATQEIIEELLDYVFGTNNKGAQRDRSHSMTVGLSANQMGITKRISIVDLAVGRKNLSDIHVLINPEIVWQSKTLVEHVEGCVNLPNIWGSIKRSKRIKVKAWDRSGNEMLLTLSGWPAILLQHEIGHLNGELFIDKLENPTKAHLVEKTDYKIYRRNKKTWSKYIDVTPLLPH